MITKLYNFWLSLWHSGLLASYPTLCITCLAWRTIITTCTRTHVFAFFVNLTQSLACFTSYCRIRYLPWSITTITFYTIVTALPAASHFVVYMPYTTPTTLKTLLASGSGRYTKQPNNQTPHNHISRHFCVKSFIPHLIFHSPLINKFSIEYIFLFMCAL